MPDASSSPVVPRLEDRRPAAPGQRSPGDPVTFERRQGNRRARCVSATRSWSASIARPLAILDDGHLDALAIGAADRVSGVLVEAREQCVVAGELDDPRVRDLERVGAAYHVAASNAASAGVVHRESRLELHGDRAMLAPATREADHERPHSGRSPDAS